LGLHRVEGRLGGIPVGDVTDRRNEFVAVGLLLAQPFVEVAARPAARDDEVAGVVQTTAYGRANATHPSRYIRHFLAHVGLLLRLSGGHFSLAAISGLSIRGFPVSPPFP